MTSRLLLAQALMLVAAGPAPQPVGWAQVVDGDVNIWTREKAGFRVAEVRGEMLMEGSPTEVRAVLTDEVYSAKSPYVAEFRTIAQLDPLTWVRYTRLAFPIISDRDYFIEVLHDSDLAEDGSGVYHTSWKPWAVDRPPVEGVVRVTINVGYWSVEKASDPNHARVTYDLLCDPGGNLPAWIINMGNKRVIPNVFRGVQDEVSRRQQERRRSEKGKSPG